MTVEIYKKMKNKKENIVRITMVFLNDIVSYDESKNHIVFDYTKNEEVLEFLLREYFYDDMKTLISFVDMIIQSLHGEKITSITTVVK